MNVEVRFSDTLKGKGLFAKKAFAPGDVIFEEVPLVSCQFAWNQHYGYAACDHCIRPLETAEENARRLTNNRSLVLPYAECCATDAASIVSCAACGVKYCSEQCRALAHHQYHRTICLQTPDRNFGHPLEALTQAWQDIHFPPETSSIMLVARILALVQQAEDRTAAVDQLMQFCHRTVNEDADLAHKLLGPAFADQTHRLLQLTAHAFSSDGVAHWLTPEGFRSLLALIGTNGQGIASSAISVWVERSSALPLGDADKTDLDRCIDRLYEDLDRESGTFLNNEGSGLYALQSACNHSCVPNAQPSFRHNDHRLSMVALAHIAPGEELLVSYLDECSLARSRHSRRKHLAEHYLFVCECAKCQAQADEPDVTSEEESSDEDLSEEDT